ncbi:MAG: hypoxanthine phosphoribosyltransferase [Clostridia bacterium]|nr:hypoxanthine phosphoribosyltransferase [Clostridia bacterium]MBR7137688.1 hypoxanthine phosphoribosyltransferase [Clostridia bacterium]
MQDKIAKILVTEEELAAKVKAIGAKISEDYAGKRPLLVSVLKGSIVFMADLMRAITIECDIDFMSCSSYGRSSKSSGVVRILKDLDNDINGRHIIVIEDILDSGLTLSYILELLQTRGAASIALCTLLDKPDRRKVDISVNYPGFTIPDEFVVGYGLDYGELYRNLPYIGVLKPEVYTD